jgi:hypothetical protein
MEVLLRMKTILDALRIAEANVSDIVDICGLSSERTNLNKIRAAIKTLESQKVWFEIHRRRNRDHDWVVEFDRDDGLNSLEEAKAQLKTWPRDREYRITRHVELSEVVAVVRKQVVPPS